MFVDSDYLQSSDTLSEARTTRRYNRKRVIVNLTKAESSSFSGDWFDIVVEDRKWIDYYPASGEDSWPKIVESIDFELANYRRRPPSCTRPSRCGVKMVGDDLFGNQPYVSQPDFEMQLRERVREVSSGSGPALLLVYGAGGVGKSSLIRHTLDGEFLRDCRFTTRVYLNVYLASNKATFDREDERKLYEQLADLLRVQRTPNENLHRALQNHLRNSSGKTLLILDDIYHRGVIECAKTLAGTGQNAVILCVSRKNYSEEIGRKFSWFNEPSINIDDMSLEALKEILRPCEKKLVTGSPNGHDIVDRLTELSNGLPLLAQAICGHLLTTKTSIESEAELYIKQLEMNYTSLLLSQEYAQEGDKKVETICRLLLIGFDRQPYEFRRRYYAFLMFNRSESVNLEDLAILWGCSEDEAEDFADQLVDMSLVRVDRDGRHFNAHVFFYDAALDFATKKDPDYSQFENLAKLRGGLLLEARNEATGENLFHIAILRRREKLVRAIARALVEHDPKNCDLFFEISCEQNDAEEIYLHLLLKANWLVEDGTLFENNFALETACYLADQLLLADRFRGEELLATMGDSDHNSVLWLLRNSIEPGVKWHQNALHVAAGNDYYELLEFLLDSGAQINTEDENGNTALHFATLKNRPLVIYRLLQRDTEIDANVRNKTGETPLLVAVKSSSHLLSCKCLVEEARRLQLKIEIDATDKNGDTPLLIAVRKNRPETAQFLLKNGAHVSVTDKVGNRPIWLALLNENMELAKSIYEIGGRLLPEENSVLQLRARLTKNRQLEQLLSTWEAENGTTVIAVDDKNFPVFRRVSGAFLRMLKISRPESSADEEKTNSFLRFAYEGNLSYLRPLILGNKPFDQPVKDTALFIASYLCHEAVVKFLCDEEQRAGPNFANENRFTSLMASAARGCAPIVATLIASGANVDAADLPSSMTALMSASLNGHLEVVNLLLEAKANYDAFDDSGMTALMFASANGHLEIVKALLSKGANVEARNETGATALMIAAQNGQEDVTKCLVTTGKAVFDNMFDKDSKTALMFASENCHIDVARIFLANKANVNATDKNAWNALMYAAKNDLDGKMVGLLIPFNADVNSRDKTGKTVLMIAAENGRDAVVRTLLENPAIQVDAKTDDEKMSALMFAAKNGHDAIVRKLLAKKVDINEANKTGMTPLLLAVENDHEHVVGTLIRKGADVNIVRDKETCTTALMIAAEKGFEGVVKTLTRNEATNLNAANFNGVTALMAASVNGHAGVVEILLQSSQPEDGPKLNVDAQQQDGYTALMLGALFGHFGVVKALLTGHNLTADVSIEDKAGNTALALASGGGFQEIVDLIKGLSHSSVVRIVVNQDEIDAPVYEMDFYD